MTKLPKFIWCWFCFHLTNKWWILGTGPIMFPIYCWFLPSAGEYIYWDYDPDAHEQEQKR